MELNYTEYSLIHTKNNLLLLLFNKQIGYINVSYLGGDLQTNQVSKGEVNTNS